MQAVKPLIGNGDHRPVGFNGAKWVIGDLGILRAGERVEQGRFADIRETNDANTESHQASLGEGQ